MSPTVELTLIIKVPISLRTQYIRVKGSLRKEQLRRQDKWNVASDFKMHSKTCDVCYSPSYAANTL